MLINEEQVYQFRRLNYFLRKLRVMGLLHYDIASMSMTDFGKPYRYRILIKGYEPNVFFGPEEAMDEVMNQWEKVSLAFDSSNPSS